MCHHPSEVSEWRELYEVEDDVPEGLLAKDGLLEDSPADGEEADREEADPPVPTADD